MSKIEWKDVTSYSRDDSAPRVPRTYEARAGSLRVIVTRRLQDKNVWYVLCYELGISSQRALNSIDVEGAKHEAVLFVEDALEDLVTSLGKIRAITPVPA